MTALTRGALVGGIAVVIGFLAAGLGYARSLVGWVRGIAVVSVWLEEGMAQRAVAAYLSANGRRVAGPRVYDAMQLYLSLRGRSELVPYENEARSSATFWLRRRPIWMTQEKLPIEHDTGSRLSSLRGVDLEQLVVDACAWASQDARGRQRRHRVVHHHGQRLFSADPQRGATPSSCSTTLSLGRDAARRLLCHTTADVDPPPTQDTLDGLVMTAEVRSLTEDVRRWFADRQWCADHRIPWRAGYLYEGEPGSGKTSHARCVAAELDLPVHTFDLATLSNEELHQAWVEAAADAPCMILIEDVDRVFDGDRNVAASGALSSGGLTYNALLNAIDGIEHHDGVLLVITANHLDKVDPAIRNRRGRIDRVVHFGPLDFTARRVLASRIIDDPQLAEQLACAHAGASTAALVGACCVAARAARRGNVIQLGPMRDPAAS